MEREKLFLQSVIVKKPIDFMEARRIAQTILKKTSKTFYEETKESYRFRNIPKTRFKPKSYVTKVVNEKVSLVLGHLL